MYIGYIPLALSNVYLVRMRASSPIYGALCLVSIIRHSREIPPCLDCGTKAANPPYVGIYCSASEVFARPQSSISNSGWAAKFIDFFASQM